jgi:nucleoside-diphosphate-sugar epimerase
MKAIVTGGLGFVGQAVARRLAEAGIEVVSLDAAAGDDSPGVVRGNIADRALLDSLLEPGDLVFHLAGVRAAAGERDFDLALRVNLDGSRSLLDACRAVGGIRLVFASTLAVFGGSAMPGTVDEATRPNPQTTYGATKASVELLVNDYARRGFVDGRVGRLATVIVRPDPAALGTTAFASAVILEGLAGRGYTLPVSLDTRLAVIGIRTAAECFVRLAELPGDVLGDDRVLNLPNLSVTAGELVEAARRAGATTEVDVRPDPEIEAVVGTWPKAARAKRALALGLPQDESLDAIVQGYVEDAYLRT